jgi:tRNA U34 5-methylaminomethyl-2-thiouridine-forming methyltransferase MnmC
MRKALARWDALHDLAPMLVSRWDSANSPPAAWHMDGQTELRVIGGEAEDTVRQWSGLADAWYLDGFSPAKNQAMWSLDLMQHVFNHTMPHGTFATYTAAGWVRRNLLAAGFSVSKCKGFSGKREMLQGCKPG